MIFFFEKIPSIFDIEIVFCWQPEMSGWIQAAMQQNTILEMKVFYIFFLQSRTVLDDTIVIVV